MDNLRQILSTCIDFYNVRLYFPPFSFTIWQALLGIVFLGIACTFVKKVFD